MEVQVPCHFCEGEGYETVTLDMAIDAGDYSLEGSRMKCWRCSGDGFTVEVTNVLVL